jgi:hypothetical protein
LRLVPAVPTKDTVGAIGELVDARYVRHIGFGDARETNEYTICKSLIGRTAAARGGWCQPGFSPWGSCPRIANGLL